MESPAEHYRVRQVNIIYFLENDTITVMEPVIEVNKLEFLKKSLEKIHLYLNLCVE